MFEAISRGDAADITNLLKQGVDINGKNIAGDTPLYIAVSLGNKELVKLLLENGANAAINCSAEDTPLKLAIDSEKEEIITELIERKDNKRDLTPLQAAVVDGQLKYVELLIENGADVNVIDVNGRTLLELARTKNHQNSHQGIIKLLQQKEGNKQRPVGENDDKGFQLHQAIFARNIANVKTLIENGADVNAKNKCGQTPLQFAMDKCFILEVKHLIAAGADMSCKTKCNLKPFEFAVARESTSLMKFILQSGKSDTPYRDLMRARTFIKEWCVLRDTLCAASLTGVAVYAPSYTAFAIQAPVIGVAIVGLTFATSAYINYSKDAKKAFSIMELRNEPYLG